MVTPFGYGFGELTCPGVVGCSFDYSGQYLLPDVPAQQNSLTTFRPSLTSAQIAHRYISCLVGGLVISKGAIANGTRLARKASGTNEFVTREQTLRAARAVPPPSR